MQMKFIRSYTSRSGVITGQIYQYDKTGNRVDVLWMSPECEDVSDAIDTAVEYAEEHGIEIESIEFPE